MEIDVEIYETRTGRCPFDIWFEGIRELNTRAKILSRLDRLKLGNFGDCKSLSDGVYELRIHYRPGIRIYFSKVGNTIVLLLCGGDKGSQAKDIKKAKEYLKDHNSRRGKHG